jgi:hypothetical protein
VKRNTNERGAATALQTTAPIETADLNHVAAQWGRIPDVERMYGIRRGVLYQLINQGKVKSACLRRQDSRTGVRLIFLPSVAALLESSVE